MEQIIINYTKTDETETLIINAKINEESFVKVLNIETVEQRNKVEDLIKWVKDGN